MESMRRIRRSSSHLYDRFRIKIEGSKAPKPVELLTSVLVETKTVDWTIENVVRCPTDLDGYIESPVFRTGSREVTEWRLRFYPRCQDQDKTVGMYLMKLTPGTRVHLELNLCLLTNDGREMATFESEDKSSICTGATKIGQQKRLSIAIPSSSRCSTLKYVVLKCEMTVGSLPATEEEEYCPLVPCSCPMSSDFARLYSSSSFSDAVLLAGKRQFQVHRAVLAARSKVFLKMFEHQMEEGSSSALINVETADSTTMEAVLRYIYSGKAEDLDVSRATKAFAVADQYELLELKALCAAFLLKNLSADNACSVAVLADLHSEPQMLGAAVRFIRANSTLVFDRPEWGVLARERPMLATNILKEIALGFKTDCAKK